MAETAFGSDSSTTSTMTSSLRPGVVKGVFSTQAKGVVGFGSTKRKVSQNIFVFVEEQPDGTLNVRELNKHFIPIGKPRVISRDSLLTEYLPEPEVYISKVVPAMREVEECVDKGDEHRARGEHISAEFEYKNALRLDEEHIRGTFGLGLSYLARGEKENADIVFRRVVALDGAFEEQHKHLFNEFGIRLRRNGMFAQALKFYKRAARLARHDDEHLFYNIARTFYAKGQGKQARRLLEKALGVNADFERAKRFLDILDKGDGGGGSQGGPASMDDLDLDDPDFSDIGT